MGEVNPKCPAQTQRPPSTFSLALPSPAGAGDWGLRCCWNRDTTTPPNQAGPGARHQSGGACGETLACPGLRGRAPWAPPAHRPPGVALRPAPASRPTTHCLFMCFNNLSGPLLGLNTYSDTSFSLKISHPLGEENEKGWEGRDKRERL